MFVRRWSRAALLLLTIIAAPACEGSRLTGTLARDAAPDVSDGDAAPDSAEPDGDDTTAVDTVASDTRDDDTLGDTTPDAVGDADDADVDPGDTVADATDATDALDAGASGSDATVIVGDPDLILLVGVVVTPTITFTGEVLVAGAEIACVAPGTTCSTSPAAAGATLIDTDGGVIAPGLIDTHNHILFDIFDDDDWLPAATYTNHNQWTNEARYAAMLDVKQCLADDSQGKPTWCPATYDGDGNLRCEMNKWGELKGLVAGTTAIVGLPGTSRACFGSLARSVDSPQNDLDGDFIQTSALFPPSKSAGDGVCANFADGDTDAYLIHCGEGTDAAALAEFAKLGALTSEPMCLYAPQTVITHGTAFTATEFAVMADHGMMLTWSPASNVALYGATTDIPAALDAGLVITLAPDWSMGGSQNLLDELRFAAAWDDAHFGDRLGPRDLVLMTTANAALALALDDRIGSLAPGMLADLVVVVGDHDPYAAIVAATPASVILTMIGGRLLYGDAALVPAAPQAPGCELLEVCGVAKFLCVAETTSANKFDQPYAAIKSALEAALVDLDAVSVDGYEFAPLAPLVRCD